MAYRSFYDLIVWQKAIKLVKATYVFTGKIPADERYGLTSQIRRAAVSIPSNIAEGANRANRSEFRHFCRIAFASGGELETQIILAGDIFGIDNKDLLKDLNAIQRMLNTLISRLALETRN